MCHSNFPHCSIRSNSGWYLETSSEAQGAFALLEGMETSLPAWCCRRADKAELCQVVIWLERALSAVLLHFSVTELHCTKALVRYLLCTECQCLNKTVWKLQPGVISCSTVCNQRRERWVNHSLLVAKWRLSLIILWEQAYSVTHSALGEPWGWIWDYRSYTLHFALQKASTSSRCMVWQVGFGLCY